MAAPWRSAPLREPMGSCTICGGTVFVRGPKGRTGPTGVPPRCAGCGSLERHRMYRVMMTALAQPQMASWSVLQFSPDPTLDPGWFKTFELSVYDGLNSLDLQDIDRRDDTYDLVFCDNVLEHVEDDRAALRELDRVIKPDGVVFLAIPDPYAMVQTREWGYADPEHHGHFRLYGMDILRKFDAELPASSVVFAVAPDPVSGTRDCAFFITRSANTAVWLCNALPGAILLRRGGDCVGAPSRVSSAP